MAVCNMKREPRARGVYRGMCTPCLPVGEGGVQVDERAVHVEGQLAHQGLGVKVLKNIL